MQGLLDTTSKVKSIQIKDEPYLVLDIPSYSSYSSSSSLENMNENDNDKDNDKDNVKDNSVSEPLISQYTWKDEASKEVKMNKMKDIKNERKKKINLKMQAL